MCHRTRGRYLLAAFASVLFGSLPAAASTVFVDWQNSGLQQDGTDAHPYRTLPRALAAAAPGDTIAIRTGCYGLDGGPLVFNKPATVRADNGLVTVTNSHPIYSRRSIFALDPNGPEIAALRRGIQVMQKRPPTDRTSWTYQANIHGTTDTAAQRAWNTCTHRNFFFFSWHRMYLYYVERILRAASGDPNLALPYWNYTDDPDPDRRRLPLAFRQPADSSNPLFVSQRNPGVNNGTAFLSDGDVDYSRAFNFANFKERDRSGFMSFGGGELPQPLDPARIHFDPDQNEGALENTPHDQVHIKIGGLMGVIATSAQDPIFYLHHANVDRLWKQWLARGGDRQDPTSDQVWMTTIFTFFDENGQPVQKSGKDILDTVSQLNYCYDDEPGGCMQCRQ